MIRHLLKTGDMAKRSEHKTVRTRALSHTFKLRHREYTNLQMLASMMIHYERQGVVTHCTILVLVISV